MRRAPSSWPLPWRWGRWPGCRARPRRRGRAGASRTPGDPARPEEAARAPRDRVARAARPDPPAGPEPPLPPARTTGPRARRQRWTSAIPWSGGRSSASAVIVGFLYGGNRRAERASNKRGAWDSSGSGLQPRHDGAAIRAAKVMEEAAAGRSRLLARPLRGFRLRPLLDGASRPPRRERAPGPAAVPRRAHARTAERARPHGRARGRGGDRRRAHPRRRRAQRPRERPARAAGRVRVERDRGCAVGAGDPVRRRALAAGASALRAHAAVDGARTFGCPSCAAPLGPAASPRCDSCGNVVDGGRFDWMVADTKLLASEARPPSLTGATEERGTGTPPSSRRTWPRRSSA